MTLSARLEALERAQAALLDTANRLAILNYLIRELGLEPVSMPQLGMLWHKLEEAQFETECELSRRILSALGVPR